MIKFENSIAQKAEFQLNKALLFYDNGRDTLVTCHDVVRHLERPVVRPGQAINASMLKKCVKHLFNKKTDAFFIPYNVLSFTEDSITWFSKPSVRVMLFKTGSEKLDAVSSKMFPQPALIFTYSGDVMVYAVKGSSRPVETTKLFQAPYYNMYSEGKVCMGNTKLPEACGPEIIEKIENLFFCSAFTHSNNDKIVRYSGGHNQFWIDNVGKTKFDNSVLVPLNKNVGDII